MIESRTGNMRAGLIQLIGYINQWYRTDELTVLEVGSYKGDSASIFATYFKRVICVDAWEQKFFNVPNTKAKDAEQEFDRRKKALLNVEKIKGRSLIVAKQFVGTVDVVYIDASHEYEDVKADLLAWKGHATKFVCGHDYWQSRFPGVIQAVNEVLGKPEKLFADMSFLVRVAE